MASGLHGQARHQHRAQTQARRSTASFSRIVDFHPFEFYLFNQGNDTSPAKKVQSASPLTISEVIDKNRVRKFDIIKSFYINRSDSGRTLLR